LDLELVLMILIHFFNFALTQSFKNLSNMFAFKRYKKGHTTTTTTTITTATITATATTTLCKFVFTKVPSPVKTPTALKTYDCL
jgi:hypothetical protein